MLIATSSDSGKQLQLPAVTGMSDSSAALASATTSYSDRLIDWMFNCTSEKDQFVPTAGRETGSCD